VIEPAGRAILGVDLGERRIGLAIVEARDIVARPLVTIPRAGTVDADAANLAALVTAHDVGELVVGLPLEARGNEGTMAAATRTWASRVGQRLGLPVSMRDERLSSHVAEERLGPMPRGRSGGPPSRTQRDRYRGRVDREAAAIILQDELDARHSTMPPGPG